MDLVSQNKERLDDYDYLFSTHTKDFAVALYAVFITFENIKQKRLPCFSFWELLSYFKDYDTIHLFIRHATDPQKTKITILRVLDERPEPTKRTYMFTSEGMGRLIIDLEHLLSKNDDQRHAVGFTWEPMESFIDHHLEKGKFIKPKLEAFEKGYS